MCVCSSGWWGGVGWERPSPAQYLHACALPWCSCRKGVYTCQRARVLVRARARARALTHVQMPGRSRSIPTCMHLDLYDLYVILHTAGG